MTLSTSHPASSEGKHAPCLFPHLGKDEGSLNEHETVDLDAATTGYLYDCSALCSAPPEMVLAAVWAVILRKYTVGDQIRFAAFSENLGQIRGAVYRVILDSETQFDALMHLTNWEIRPYEDGDLSINTALFMGKQGGQLSGNAKQVAIQLKVSVAEPRAAHGLTIIRPALSISTFVLLSTLPLILRLFPCKSIRQFVREHLQWPLQARSRRPFSTLGTTQAREWGMLGFFPRSTKSR
jgi:hypothetical protein